MNTHNPQVETATITVGSTNPVKVQATLAGFSSVFPKRAFQANGVAVDSGVPDQPHGETETRQGAISRRQAVQAAVPESDYWVGIEGGVEFVSGVLFASAWISIADRWGRTGEGKTALFPLPPEIGRLLREGWELGHANDRVFGEHNSKHQGGAVGSLTGGVISRTQLYEHAIALALVPFRQPDLFPAETTAAAPTRPATGTP